MELLQQLTRARPRRRQQHASLRVRDVLKTYVEPIRRQGAPSAIRPLDHRDAPRVERLLPPRGSEVLPLEAIQIEMKERHPSTVMLVKDDEGGARHVGRVQPEPRGDALREHGLPRSELAP